MKRLLCLILIFCITPSLLLPVCINAQKNDTPVVWLDGEIVHFSGINPYICNTQYGQKTLMPLRMLYTLLNYKVVWDGEVNGVTVYNESNDRSVYFEIDSNVLVISTQSEKREITVDYPAKLIDNRTFISLDAVGKAFDFNADYFEKYNAISISSYNHSDYHLTEMIDKGILYKDDIGESAYITNREAIYLYSRVRGGYITEKTLEKWYNIDELEPLDGVIDDDLKKALMSIYSGSYEIVSVKDILETDFDEKLTYSDALKYTLRMLYYTNFCHEETGEIAYSNFDTVYKVSLLMGFIDECDNERLNDFITREEFFTLLCKAFNTRTYYDYYGLTSIREIDRYEPSNVSLPMLDITAESIEKQEKEYVKIDVQAMLDDNMNLKWTLPDEIKNTKKLWTDIRGYTKDGKEISYHSTSAKETQISAYDLVDIFCKALPEKAEKIRVSYYDNLIDSSINGYFEIELSDINVNFTDEKLVPGVFRYTGNPQFPKTVTLKEGEFVAGAYYFITSCDVSRLAENTKYKTGLFSAVEKNGMVILGNKGVYELYTDELYIREIKVSGDADSGFTLSISQQSDESFVLVDENKTN